MSGELPISVRSFDVGAYRVTMTIPRPRPGKPVHCTMEWTPREPSRLTSGEWAEYRAGRNHALAELAGELGINVAVLEL